MYFHICIRMEENLYFSSFLIMQKCTRDTRRLHEYEPVLCFSASSTNGGICSQALYTGLVIYAPALALNQSTSCTQPPSDTTDMAEWSLFL